MNMKNFLSKTKASYRHNSKKSPYPRIIVSIIGIFLVLYTFGNILGVVSSYISAPIFSVKNWIAESSATVPTYFRSRNELLDEIDSLKQEIAFQSGTEATIKRISQENDTFRSLLSIQKNDRIAARVTARPPYLPYDALLLDRGSEDGVKVNAIVFSGRDQAIGIVVRVFSHSSLVTLFSTSGIETTIYILGPNIYTTSYGEGGGVIRVNVPQGIDLEVGNTVILPLLEASVLGVIDMVESVSTQPEQYGYIVFDIPIQSLQTVSISSRVLEKISFKTARMYVEEYEYQRLMVTVPEDFSIEIDTSSSTDEILESDSIEGEPTVTGETL